MTIANFCVGVVITIIIVVGTAIFNMFVEYMNGTSGDLGLAWLIASIGFGVCLTIILVEHGFV